MMHAIFGTVWGWIGTAGIVCIACGAVAYFIPQFRIYALAVVGVVVSAATIYTKGNRDRAKLETKRKEEAVRNARKKYDEIENRPDTPDTLADKLRRNGF